MFDRLQSSITGQALTTNTQKKLDAQVLKTAEENTPTTAPKI